MGKMSRCRCDRFQEIAGPATRVYTTDFLERTGEDEGAGEVHYRCRACGTPWKRVEPGDTKEPKLIKLPKSAMV